MSTQFLELVILITHRNPLTWNLINNFFSYMKLWDAIVQNRNRFFTRGVNTQRQCVSFAAPPFSV